MSRFALLRCYQGIFLFCFLVDRITKYFALKTLTEPMVFNNFFSLHLTINKGLVWGLLYAKQFWLFVTLITLIISAISTLGSYVIVRWYNHHLIFGEILVLAGALSNLFDRFLYGGVVDFIVFSYHVWVWPTFNIADSCIVIGIVIMLISMLRKQ